MRGGAQPAAHGGGERPGGRTPPDERQRPKRKLAVLILVMAALGLAAVLLVGPVREELVDFVSGLGTAAPAAFVALYVVLSLVLVPSSVLALAAGVLFGAVLGGGLVVLGGSISAAIGFLIGRKVGREPIERVAGERLDDVDHWLRDHGIVTIAIARNLPAVPYGLLNYAAGLTGIPARRFIGGTVLGILPGSLAFATFGGSLDDPLSPQFVTAVVLLVAVVLGGVLLERRMESGNA